MNFSFLVLVLVLVLLWIPWQQVHLTERPLALKRTAPARSPLAGFFAGASGFKVEIA